MSTTNKKEKSWEEKTERERQFMKDKKGMPLNPSLQSKPTGKYGVLNQH